MARPCGVPQPSQVPPALSNRTRRLSSTSLGPERPSYDRLSGIAEHAAEPLSCSSCHPGTSC
jgi:hypothetical protein